MTRLQKGHFSREAGKPRKVFTHEVFALVGLDHPPGPLQWKGENSSFFIEFFAPNHAQKTLPAGGTSKPGPQGIL
jgi:hypothetical protein